MFVFSASGTYSTFYYPFVVIHTKQIAIDN